MTSSALFRVSLSIRWTLARYLIPYPRHPEYLSKHHNATTHDSLMMAPATPRKQRNRVPRASDYDSDAVQAGASIPQPAASVQAQTQHDVSERPTQDLNLSVLKRYIPDIYTYELVSHNVTVFPLESEGWGESTTKGPLFLCYQAPLLSNATLPRSSVFVMNRQSLDNLTVDLANAFECEQDDKLIMLRTTSVSGDDVGWGLYIDDANELQDAWSKIQRHWIAARAGQ